MVQHIKTQRTTQLTAIQPSFCTSQVLVAKNGALDHSYRIFTTLGQRLGVHSAARPPHSHKEAGNANSNSAQHQHTQRSKSTANVRGSRCVSQASRLEEL